jgi:hypothetical protein
VWAPAAWLADYNHMLARVTGLFAPIFLPEEGKKDFRFNPWRGLLGKLECLKVLLIQINILL